MSHASPLDVIARLPWDSSEIGEDTFLSTGDLQSYLDEAHAQLQPVVTVAMGLSADSLDATTTAQLRSAECDFAVYRALQKMEQSEAAARAERAWLRWLEVFKRYTSATHLAGSQGDRSRSNAPTNGRAPQFAGRDYGGH